MQSNLKTYTDAGFFMAAAPDDMMFGSKDDMHMDVRCTMTRAGLKIENKCKI